MAGLTPEEQQRVNALVVTLRAVEHGCPGLNDHTQQAVTAFLDLMALWEARRSPASRPLQAVAT